MKNAVVFQRAALIWKIYHCPWEKGSRRLISRKENVFFIKKKKLQQEYYTGKVWMLRKQKTVSFNHEELDYSKGT